MEQIVDIKDIKLPKNWSDLSAPDVLWVTKQKMLAISESEFMSRSIIYFLKLEPKKGGLMIQNGELLFKFSDKSNNRNCYIDAVTILTLFEEIKWLNDTLNLMQCPIFRGLKCPNYKLYLTSLQEFLNIDNAYCEFSRDNSEINLDIFFKSLYHGSKSEFKKITEFDKMAVIFWYSGLKIWLKEKYPYVFLNEEVEDEPDDEARQLPVEEHLISLLSSLNDGRVADNELIKSSPMHEVFYTLNQKIEYSEQNKK